MMKLTKRLLSLTLISTIGLGSAALAPAFAQSTITVGIVGDQTGASDLDTSYQFLQQGVDALKNQSLDIVLHVGDLVESHNTDQEVTMRFKQGVTLLNSIGVPWYLTAGDHDVNPTTIVQNSNDRSKEALFKQLYSGVNSLVQNKLYYSFDHKNFHIVVLYSIEHLNTDPRWGNVFYSKPSDDQMAWLEADLKANTAGKDGTIVLMHQPMWYNWTGWSEVHKLLAAYNVDTVIAGHFHYNQTQIVQDGITYRVVGATGGDTKQGSANAGDLQHVSIMTLTTGSAPEFKMIPLTPFVQSNWTSKQVMDRVQAVDTDLGNIYSFGTDSPVFLQHGNLVNQCNTANRAQLVVKSVGNAAAVPVNVTVNVIANNIDVSTATFGTGLCQTDMDEYECQLRPSAGVAVSNNSIIQASTYPVPPPLWTGTLMSGATAPSVGDVITLKLSQSFNQDNQTYLVETTGTTTIKSCS